MLNSLMIGQDSEHLNALGSKGLWWHGQEDKLKC
jgi:hypothetical protein